MRLFPGDEVPRLTAFPEEMGGPWIVPPSFPRLHRRRLAVMVGRAVRAFDPRVRFIELRWADRWHLERGTLRLPPHPLIWWRISAITDTPGDVLAGAPRLAPGHHLFDCEADPGVTALGWMSPLKVRLLERITEVLVDERPLADPEPLLDALDDAARHLESPIDLLDFTEGLIAQRATGLSMEEAIVDAMAGVVAARLDVEAVTQETAARFLDALRAAVQPGPFPPAVHAELSLRGFAEPSPEVRLPMLDWLLRPGVLDRAERRLRTAQRPSAWPPAFAALPPPAIPLPAPVPEGEEAAADAVLEQIRAGEDRQWDQARKMRAADALLRFAGRLRKDRGHLYDAAVMEREAALLEVAARLAEEAGELMMAIRANVGAADCYRYTGRLRDARERVARAAELAGRTGDSIARADVLLATGNLSLRQADISGAKAAYEAALPIYRETGERLGEAQVLHAMGELFRLQDDLSGAKAVYETALLICRETGSRLGEANVLGGMGELLLQQADLPGAKAAYEAALPIFREIASRLGEANVLTGMGQLSLRQDDLSGAKAAYEAALLIYREIGDRLGEANVLQGIGDLARKRDDPAEARAAYEAALAIYQRIEDRRGEENAMAALAELEKP